MIQVWQEEVAGGIWIIEEHRTSKNQHPMDGENESFIVGYFDGLGLYLPKHRVVLTFVTRKNEEKFYEESMAVGSDGLFCDRVFR